MICRQLSEEEVIEIYSTVAQNHFPSDELKPVKKVRMFLSEKMYLGYGLFRNEKLLAYAFFLRLPHFDKLLLDYYAVLDEFRNEGTGSAFLQLLRDELKEKPLDASESILLSGFYIESENPDYAKNDSEKAIREKRIAFYEKNYADFTGILTTLYGVDYRIFYIPLKDTPLLAPAAYRQELEHIYRNMFPSPLFEQVSRIY